MVHTAQAQTVNTHQQVVLEGIRSSAGYGSFLAARYASDGSLILLLDEHDGIRLLKTDPSATVLRAQAQTGSLGDVPVAMTLDPAGNIYVTGTTTSGTLSGTSGTAFPTRADNTTNSFLAKYDANLNLLFLTYLGAGRTSATGVAASSDAVFVTGSTFSSTFPVSVNGLQQTPATGSTQNGFAERFDPTGATLLYATYLTGANGNTLPTAIAVDGSDNAYLTGLTTSSGYPTVSALQPSILGSTSGFFTKLNPTGSAFIFSTFLAGQGITGLAFDTSTASALLTGNVSLGQFPIQTVSTPLTSTTYQTFLRIPSDGQSVTSSVALVPGATSSVTAGPNGDAWIAGSLIVPLFPGTPAPDYSAGDTFLLHLTSTNAFDQTLRFGGTPAKWASYAALTTAFAAPAIDNTGTYITLPGTITATVSASLLSSQTFDLPLVASPNTILPSALHDILPTATSCGTGSMCSGSGAFLAQIATSASAPSLSVAIDTAPNLTLRNMGSSTASGLSITATGYTVSGNCGAELAPSNQCSLALTGTGPGGISVSASGTPSTTVSVPATTSSADPIVLSTSELDFGIEASTSLPALQTLTVTNLSAASQSFTSALDGGSKTAATFAESTSDCVSGNGTATHVLAAGQSCHITFAFTASSSSANDGPVRASWKIGLRDIVLTGFSQAASLSVSAAEVDFGTQILGTNQPQLPRYLYLSNNSGSAVSHAIVTLPTTSAFRVTDNCPSALEPHTFCQLGLTYLSPASPSLDTITLSLDQGITVLVTGQTQSLASAVGTSANPTLSLSATALVFPTAVVVTGISNSSQAVTLTNTGSTPLPLATALTGDFTLTNGCPALLPGGGSCSLILGFIPSQPGTRDGLLSVAAGNGFAPAYVSLTGVGTPILPANNGTLDLGQTLVGEPAVAWYKIQQPLASLTASVNNPQYGVALVQETGIGHGILPASSFSPSATASCNNCWLGVQLLTQTAGSQSSILTLHSTVGGSAYTLTVSGVALPVQGLLLTPIQQDFGPVAVHSASAPLTFTLANLLAPASAVTVQSVTATGDFSVAPNGSGGPSCTTSLTPTASCFLQLTFSPTATGDRNGALTIVTTGGTVTASLTGYGSDDTGLSVQPTSLTFSNVPGTAALQQTVTLSNTGTATLSVGPAASSDPSFTAASTCGNLLPGALCNVIVTFTPQSSNTTAALSIPVSSTLNGQTTATIVTVPLTGGYTAEDAGLQIVAGQINFGSTSTANVGSTRQLTVNNLTAKTLNMTFSMPRQFPLAGAAPCPTLAPGASCSFNVSFLPVTGGELTGSVFASGISADGSTTAQALTYMIGYGSGSGSLLISSTAIPYASLSFGQVTSGQSAQRTATLTNSGQGTLSIRRITSDPPFLSTTTCGATLAPGANCTVTLMYTPVDEITASATGTPRSDSGSLVIESDAVTSPDVLELSGTVLPVVSSNPASSSTLAGFDLTQSSLTFANTQVGQASAAQTVTLTNTGTTTLHMLGTMISADFSQSTTCSTVLPGATCTFTVQFAPTTASTSLIRSGTLELLSDAATSLEFISLIGTAAPASITLNPTVLNFGTTNVGAMTPLAVTATNTGVTPVTFTGLSATGDYSVTQGTCPAVGSTLAPGGSCQLSVTFSPTAVGVRSGVMSLATDATQIPLTVALTGTGVAAQLQVTPGALAFGNIGVSASASLTLTLLNTGSAELTGLSNLISGSNPADFAVTVPCSVTSLAPQQGCTETVTFTPSSLGSRSAVLAIASSDPTGPAMIPLTGTGVAGGSFALTVAGGSAATVTVQSGYPAIYPLMLTPLNGFAGEVALTCTPIVAAQYASCSLLASTLTLNGAALSSTATINTITSAPKLAQGSTGMAALGLGLLFTPLAMLYKGRRSRFSAMTLALLVAVLCGAGLTGCGQGPGSVGNIHYTPAGTYQYEVTASSTTGVPTSSTVTLNLIVQ